MSLRRTGIMLFPASNMTTNTLGWKILPFIISLKLTTRIPHENEQQRRYVSFNAIYRIIVFQGPSLHPIRNLDFQDSDNPGVDGIATSGTLEYVFVVSTILLSHLTHQP